MNFEPQKFFIGVVDFFSILLPGTILTFLLQDRIGPWALGQAYYHLDGAQGWAVFLLCAYLLGHFVFLIGSFLLDDLLYDRVRNATPFQIRRELAKGKHAPSRLVAWLARWLFKKGKVDEAVRAAGVIRNHHLDPLGATDSVNIFQWSKSFLALNHPEALASVQRFEADSKFFRSLSVVLLFTLLWAPRVDRPGVAAASAVLLILSLWRYRDQRVKATSQAYWHVIAAEAQRERGYRRPRQTFRIQRAGGVVFRVTAQGPLFLVVQSTNAKDVREEWVLPKGKVKPDETLEETAVREVREETGVWARVLRSMDAYSFTQDSGEVAVSCFLMEYETFAISPNDPKVESRSDWQRHIKWITAAEAKTLELKEVAQAIEQAAALLSTTPDTRSWFRRLTASIGVPRARLARRFPMLNPPTPVPKLHP